MSKRSDAIVKGRDRAAARAMLRATGMDDENFEGTIPAAGMALARMNIPGVVLYGGSIMPGNHKGKDLGAGACGGQFTANSMAMAMTFLGLSPMGVNDVPAISDGIC